MSLIHIDDRIEKIVDDFLDKALEDQNFSGTQGPKGEKGDKGDPGNNGLDGATGPQGIQGPAGADSDPAQVAANLSVDDAFRDALALDLSTEYADDLRGAQGPQGEQGAQGEAGPQGEVGPQGQSWDAAWL